MRQIADAVAFQRAQHAARARAACVDSGGDLDACSHAIRVTVPASPWRHHRDAVFHAQVQHRRVRHLLADLGVIADEILMPQREIAIAQQQRDAAALKRLAHLHVVGIGDVDLDGGVRNVAQFLGHSQQPLHAFVALGRSDRRRAPPAAPAAGRIPTGGRITPSSSISCGARKSRRTPPACAR